MTLPLEPVQGRPLGPTLPHVRNLSDAGVGVSAGVGKVRRLRERELEPANREPTTAVDAAAVAVAVTVVARSLGGRCRARATLAREMGRQSSFRLLSFSDVREEEKKKTDEREGLVLLYCRKGIQWLRVLVNPIVVIYNRDKISLWLVIAPAIVIQIHLHSPPVS
jgi:hypothetical protein